jgi:hypothetical protein
MRKSHSGMAAMCHLLHSAHCWRRSLFRSYLCLRLSVCNAAHLQALHFRALLMQWVIGLKLSCLDCRRCWVMLTTSHVLEPWMDAVLAANIASVNIPVKRW